MFDKFNYKIYGKNIFREMLGWKAPQGGRVVSIVLILNICKKNVFSLKYVTWYFPCFKRVDGAQND